MYLLTTRNTRRALPAAIRASRDLQSYTKRAKGESVGIDKGGDEILILDADGHMLALYEFLG